MGDEFPGQHSDRHVDQATPGDESEAAPPHEFDPISWTQVEQGIENRRRDELVSSGPPLRVARRQDEQWRVKDNVPKSTSLHCQKHEHSRRAAVHWRATPSVRSDHGADLGLDLTSLDSS